MEKTLFCVNCVDKIVCKNVSYYEVVCISAILILHVSLSNFQLYYYKTQLKFNLYTSTNVVKSQNKFIIA